MKTDGALAGERAARHRCRNLARCTGNPSRGATPCRKRDRADKEKEKRRGTPLLRPYRAGAIRSGFQPEEMEETERLLDACPTRFRHWEWGYLSCAPLPEKQRGPDSAVYSGRSTGREVGPRVGPTADAPVPRDHESGRRRKLAPGPRPAGPAGRTRHQARRHHSIIGTFALVPGLGRPASSKPAPSPV